MPIAQHKHKPVLSHGDQHAMAQVGWIGGSGRVYGLDDDINEPANFTPLYIAVGMWEDLGEGRWGIKD